VKVKRNLFMIGLSMTIAAAVVIFSIVWLGKSNFFVRGVPLNLLVDNAGGIAPGNEVFYRGLKVGSVINASVTTEGVVLKLKIEDVDKIPIDSKFEIGDFSLISGTAIEITPGSSPMYFQPNDTVRGYAAYGLNQAIAGLQNLESQISNVLTNVNSLTGDGTKRKVDYVLDNLNKTITQLNIQVNGNLKQTLTNVNKITSDNKENITLLIQSLSENSKQLSAFLNTSSKSASELDSLLTNLNAGKGSLGNIVKSDSLYKSLNKTIGSIDSLVTDIKANPKRYINVSVF
jgi:phospholipid/cholesterol/gamma-HCH transport system substrate-binding protein